MTTAQPQSSKEAVEEPSAVPGPAEPGGGLRSAMAPPAVAAAAGALLLAGGALMRVPEAAGFLGPRFFPLTVGALLVVTALASAARALATAPSRRAPARERDKPALNTGDEPSAQTGDESPAETPAAAPDEIPGSASRPAPRSDWRTLATMAATLIAHVVLLAPLGWLLAGTLLFWGISYALDGRRPLLDLCIAVALSGVVQVVFSGLLGVTLPAGVLGRVL